MRTVRRYVATGLAGALALVAVVLASPAEARQRQAAVPLAGPVKIEAENYTKQRGTRIVEVPFASGGRMVDRISDGNWLRYNRVTVQVAGRSFLCFSSPAPVNTEVATVDVRIGSRSATPITSIVVRTNVGQEIRQWATGGEMPEGVHTVFLTVRQPKGALPFALDYLMFSHLPPPPSLNC